MHLQLTVLNLEDVHLVSNCVVQGVCNSEIDNIRTVHVTSYLRNLADLPRRFSANLRAAKCGCP